MGVVSAELIDAPPFTTHESRRGKRGEGVRYERKVQAYLASLYGVAYVPSPWVRFCSGDSPATARYCQPDGLLVDITAGKITIVEVKLKHTPAAWWQVRELYEPVLTRLFPRNLWRFAACEIVQWFDPHTSFPERLRHVADVAEVPAGAFGLHIWNPRRSPCVASRQVPRSLLRLSGSGR